MNNESNENGDFRLSDGLVIDSLWALLRLPLPEVHQTMIHLAPLAAERDVEAQFDRFANILGPLDGIIREMIAAQEPQFGRLHASFFGQPASVLVLTMQSYLAAGLVPAVDAGRWEYGMKVLSDALRDLANIVGYYGTHGLRNRPL